jgi:hypothetical protein
METGPTPNTHLPISDICHPKNRSDVVYSPNPSPPLVKFTETPPPDNLPGICPQNYCKDPVPSRPSQTLVLLFVEQRDLLAKDSKSTAGYRTVTNQICEQIKHENLSALAQVRGWPTSVDFDGIPECVNAERHSCK